MGTKALVVDDSAFMRKAVVDILQDYGVAQSDIVEKSNGEEAIRAALDEKFDIILMDWNMPGGDGLDALRRIRATGTEIPIVFVTAEGTKEQFAKAFRAGASGFVRKPFTPKDLRTKLEALVPQ